MLDDKQYSELVSKLAAEMIDDTFAELEKEAAEKDNQTEKEAENEMDTESIVKQALEVYEEAQIMKQAASEAEEEAQLNEDASIEVLDQVGIDLDDLVSDEDLEDQEN